MHSKVAALVMGCLLVLFLAPAGRAEEQPEMKKVVLTKLDGTKVEKLVEKPKYGGVFNFAEATSPLYFDESFGGSWHAYTMMLTNEDLLDGDWTRGPSGTGEVSWIYHMVLRQAQRGAVAESWELTDPETMVFHIRKGVRFHDKAPASGREVTAEDVVFSLYRLWHNPKCYHYGAFPWDTHIESMEAPDMWTFVIKCKPGKTGMVFEKAAALSKIVPKDVVEKHGDLTDWRNACGTGPFMLTEYVPDNSITYQRFPDYWGKDPYFPENRLPYLDGVKTFIIPDASTRMAAMRTGKVDYLGRGTAPSREDAESLLKTNPEMKHKSYFGGSVYGLWMRIDKPDLPFHHVKVRHALAMAIDQRAILDSLYGGKGETFSWPVAPIPEFKDYFIPLDQLPESVREQFEYHPEKAKQLLAEAGYPNGFKTEVNCYQEQVDTLSIVKNYWQKIGVDLSLDVKEYGAFTSLGWKRTFKQTHSYPASGTFPFLFIDVTPGNAYNFSAVDDPFIKEIKSKVDASYFKEAERIEAYRKYVPHALEQCYVIQLPMPNSYTFWHSWVRNFQGETELGFNHTITFPRHIWLDQEMKKKATG